MNTREIIKAFIDEIDDVLVPIAGKVIENVFAGKPWKAELSRAERDAIAAYAQKRFDAALERGKGESKPGGG